MHRNCIFFLFNQDLGAASLSGGPPGTAPVRARLVVNVTDGDARLLVYFLHQDRSRRAGLARGHALWSTFTFIQACVL